MGEAIITRRGGGILKTAFGFMDIAVTVNDESKSYEKIITGLSFDPIFVLFYGRARYGSFDAGNYHDIDYALATEGQSYTSIEERDLEIYRYSHGISCSFFTHSYGQFSVEIRVWSNRIQFEIISMYYLAIGL